MTPPFKWFLIGVAAIALLAYLTGCTSSGLYAMSDQWCDSHPDASPAHCERRAVIEHAGTTPTVEYRYMQRLPNDGER
jgi:hypothetical protein